MDLNLMMASFLGVNLIPAKRALASSTLLHAEGLPEGIQMKRLVGGLNLCISTRGPPGGYGVFKRGSSAEPSIKMR